MRALTMAEEVALVARTGRIGNGEGTIRLAAPWAQYTRELARDVWRAQRFSLLEAKSLLARVYVALERVAPMVPALLDETRLPFPEMWVEAGTTSEGHRVALMMQEREGFLSLRTVVAGTGTDYGMLPSPFTTWIALRDPDWSWLPDPDWAGFRPRGPEEAWSEGAMAETLRRTRYQPYAPVLHLLAQGRHADQAASYLHQSGREAGLALAVLRLFALERGVRMREDSERVARSSVSGFRPALTQRVVEVSLTEDRVAAAVRQSLNPRHVREHDVRGHWCTSHRTGKRWWRRSHVRGDAALGRVEHTYRVVP